MTEEKQMPGSVEEAVAKSLHERGFTGLCSAHRNGENPECRTCYPEQQSGEGVCCRRGELGYGCICKRKATESPGVFPESVGDALETIVEIAEQWPCSRDTRRGAGSCNRCSTKDAAEDIRKHFTSEIRDTDPLSQSWPGEDGAYHQPAGLDSQTPASHQSNEKHLVICSKQHGLVSECGTCRTGQPDACPKHGAYTGTNCSYCDFPPVEEALKGNNSRPSQTAEISTDHLVRALRIYVNDLTDQHSPFNKGSEYLRDMAGWIACAATRLETVEKSRPGPDHA